MQLELEQIGEASRIAVHPRVARLDVDPEALAQLDLGRERPPVAGGLPRFNGIRLLSSYGVAASDIEEKATKISA